MPHIINVLNGKKGLLLSRKYEEQLQIMFKENTFFRTLSSKQEKLFIIFLCIVQVL